MRRYGLIAALLVFSLFATGSLALAGSYRSDYYTPQHNQRYNDRGFEAAIFGAVLGGITAAVLYEASRPQPVYIERRYFRQDRRYQYRKRHHERKHYRQHRHERRHHSGHGHH